jgi:hypothetical protein
MGTSTLRAQRFAIPPFIDVHIYIHARSFFVFYPASLNILTGVTTIDVVNLDLLRQRSIYGRQRSSQIQKNR